MRSAMNNFRQNLQFFGLYQIDEVLSHVRQGRQQAQFKQFSIDLTSVRYRTFAKSVVCASCGIQSAYFKLERHYKYKKDSTGKKIRDENGKKVLIPDDKATPHFNLYATNEYGHEILMTRDHIIPKSHGGSEHISNMQTMCRPCNERKGPTYNGKEANCQELGSS